MKRLMIDLETLGTGMSPVVFAIGCSLFEGDKELEHFYRLITPHTCLSAGLEMDVDTLYWWLSQNEAAKAELTRSFTEGEDLAAVLEEFRNFWETFCPDEVWAHGVGSDLVWLRSAYKHLDAVPPWDFRKERCYRTLRNLTDPLECEEPVTPHHALSDAKAQSEHLIKMLASLSLI